MQTMQTNIQTADTETGEVFEPEQYGTFKEVGMPILSKSVANIIPALCQVRLDMDGVGFNGYNRDFDYNYRKADDVYAAAGIPLAKNGIMIIPSVLSHDVKEFRTNNDKKMFMTTVKLAIMMIHSSCESITQFYQGTAMDTADKGTYKAYTGCLKYHLQMTFLIGGDDAENDGGHGGDGGSGAGRQGSQRGSRGAGSARSASNGENRKGQPPSTKTDNTPKISANQADCLKELIKEAGFEEKDVLDFYKIKKLSDLPLSQYDAAVKYLEKVKAKAGNKSTNEGDSHAPSGTPTTGVISLQQVKDLEKLICETGTDQARFLQFLNVETLDKLPVDRYDEAMKALEGKKNSKGSDVNEVISALAARNIPFQVDEANWEIHATPNFNDAGAKAFLSQLGFKPGFGGKPWIKMTS